MNTSAHAARGPMRGIAQPAHATGLVLAAISALYLCGVAIVTAWAIGPLTRAPQRVAAPVQEAIIININRSLKGDRERPGGGHLAIPKTPDERPANPEREGERDNPPSTGNDVTPAIPATPLLPPEENTFVPGCEPEITSSEAAVTAQCVV